MTGPTSAPPTLLILGVCNKLLKQLGSDSLDSRVKA